MRSGVSIAATQIDGTTSDNIIVGSVQVPRAK
jgi:hypothetical protein